jgi:hypothetical protein
MGARHYDPATGRFLQPGPFGIAASEIYAYAANNPYVFWDPSGLSPLPIHWDLPTVGSSSTQGQPSDQTLSAFPIGASVAGNLPGLGGSGNASFGVDDTWDVGFTFSGAIGPEGPTPGVSATAALGFYGMGGLRTLAGLGNDAGLTTFSPLLLGGGVSGVFDGGPLRMLAGGDPSMARTVAGVVVDVGVGTPGANVHVYGTSTLSIGFNPLRGELFACGNSCAVLDLY